jgi:hypothetical protein
MVSEDDGRAVPGLSWGRSCAERIALGLPVHQERPRPDMRKIERRDRLAQIFCTEHSELLGVLTDTALITRTANTPYPGTSGASAGSDSGGRAGPEALRVRLSRTRRASPPWLGRPFDAQRKFKPGG